MIDYEVNSASLFWRLGCLRAVYVWTCILCILIFSGCSTSRTREEILLQLLNEMKVEDRYSFRESPDVMNVSAGRAGEVSSRSAAHIDSAYMDQVKAGGKSGRARMDSNESRAHGSELRYGARTPPDLTIQPDCLVRISVDEDPSLDDSYLVNEIGAIDLKYIGPIILINKTETEAADKISEVLVSREFKKATVQTKILRASYDKIKLSGAVVQQGLVRIGAGDSISLNDALLRAGGITASARGARIKIIRDGLLSAVGDILKGEEYSLVDDNGLLTVPEVRLNNNDIVIVFTSEIQAEAEGGEKEVLVLGEVNRPGVYRFSANEPCTLMHLIFKMGGLAPYADKKAVVVKRTDENGYTIQMTVNAAEILKEGSPECDRDLMNGDTIVVPTRRISLF